MRSSSRRRNGWARGAAALALAATWLAAPPARAEPPTFLAETDRNQVAPGEVFLYEVTVTTSGQRVESYHPPEFKGLEVVSAPQGPNQSTQMQMGAGGTFIQNSLSWRYQLTPAAGQKGMLAIGPARVRVDGKEMRSNQVNIRVGGTGGGPAAGAPAAGAPPSASSSSGATSDEPPPPTEANAANFVRAVPDKTRVFVGEQVTVGWYLYFTESQNKYETITEPRTDGFWTEDVTPPNARNRVPQTQQLVGGRVYQVASLFKRALFPLQAGKLTISPIESEIAQVDFFGMSVRRQRLKAEPVVIEALPLPRAGQPDGFDPSHVGRFTLEARADRPTVAVGEAVTLTIEVKGQGNLRNLRAPALARLDGWKSYEPKITVNLDPGDLVSGSKTVEYLLLPERPGTTMLPSFELAYFDPQTRAYATAKSDPLRLEVTSDGTGRMTAAPAGGAGPRPTAGAGPVENVIATEIRPIRTRATLNRDLGATFYRSRPFLGVLLVPPLALALGRLLARARERLAADSQRGRRRRVRQMVRQRLGAAEGHRDAGRWPAFHIEIDRVLREVLTARLRRPVSGLRMDELRDLLLQRGMPADEAGRIIAALEACDLARFAPATADAAAARQQMSAALERAGELIVTIDKAPLRDEAAT
ncbi:MAG TPA: BatD family protein [Polyangia bacterium]|jgi:hypothetical protein|nr:BatD family protein [Polyangia bacterium]